MIKVLEKPKIVTKPIIAKLDDPAIVDKFIQSFNYVPYLYICKLSDTDTTESEYGTTIDVKDITYVKIYNNKFLPEVELYCDDSKGILFNDLYPFDHDTLLSMFVKSNSENTMPIRMDFRITEYETIK